MTEDHCPAALGLHRAGRSAGPDWGAFLAAFVALVRVKRRHRPDRRALDRFFQARDALLRDGVGAPAEDVLHELSRVRVWSVLTRLSDDDPIVPPPLEPMLPALAETVLFWSGGQRQVLVIHDGQSALTANRLSRLQQVLADAAASSPAGAGEAGAVPAAVSPLAGLVMVDSRDDPRVQVADACRGGPATAGDGRRPTPVVPFPDVTARSRAIGRGRF